ncbi:MAG: hypothetical protein NUV80_02250 [Candidatus Berkelbacteria bacterium]|nr:hypothetical protein [Candidatus Berkelbacteria bacterium]MCR4307354.1 hypothetical protein [Candidatus Berkelbacteria bacterium]
MKKLILLIATVVLAVTVSAQKIGVKDPVEPTVKLKSVAILPLMFRKGDSESKNKTAIDAYRDNLLDAFTKLGIGQVDQARVNASWQRSIGQMFEPSRFDLPIPEDVVKFGQDLGVDYVVASRCRWDVKSLITWKGLQTRVRAKVDLWIVDIAKSEFSLKVDGIETDSRENIPDLKAAISLLILPITFVSGGPETPHMVRSGQLSVAKALDPWIEKQSAGKIRIGG